MTSATPSPEIPEGVSFAELQAHMAKALPENPKKSADLFDGKTQEEIVELAQKFIQESSAACKDPMIHKVMVLNMMQLFIQWHQALASAAVEEGDQQFANFCYRDMGVLQAAAEMIRRVSFERRDFTCN